MVIFFSSPQLILHFTKGAQWFYNRENYPFPRIQRGSNIFQRVQLFPVGPNANFFRNPYNLCFSRGMVRTPPPSGSAHENIRWNLCLFWFYTSHQQSFRYKGTGLLGWTSSKLGLMFLLKDTTQWRRWISISSQALYHWATALPHQVEMMLHLICSTESFLPDLFWHYRLKNSLFKTFHILFLHTE